MMRSELHIAGEWIAGTGEPFASRDPATGAEVWRGRAASEGDVAHACAAARAAFPSWAALAVEDRALVLRRFAEVLQRRTDWLAEAICREVGKPRWEARTEVQSMIGKIAISIDAQQQRCGERRTGAVVTRFRPHGVVAVFGPFNFPGHLPNGHIAPALLAGNTVVFKPSERAPGVAARTMAAWIEAGPPPGALNLVHGARATGQALVARPEIDGVFFTGSARGGRWLHEHFAGRPEKILALEMGGNNPLVVWNARAAAAAVVTTIQSAFLTAGQRCTCARRLIVRADAGGDAFLAQLVAATQALRVGAWTDEPEPFMGPVIGPDAAQALRDVQANLVARGAKVLIELRQLAPDTGRVAPGIIDVTDVGDRPDEEIFGPLLQVIRVRDFDAALAEANATRFGLAAGLLSDERELWEKFRADVRAGIVNWNQPLTGASSAAPFGGIGRSGNHRPSAYFAADYCNHPVASIEAEAMSLPASLPPGLNWPATP